MKFVKFIETETNAYTIDATIIIVSPNIPLGKRNPGAIGKCFTNGLVDSVPEIHIENIEHDGTHFFDVNTLVKYLHENGYVFVPCEFDDMNKGIVRQYAPKSWFEKRYDS